MLCAKLLMPTTRSSEMIEASGGVVNFIAILIPTLMALYYGFRCLFQTDAAIAEWGIGAASESMVKICGCHALTQGVMYAIILFTSPAGAWELFAFSTIWAALFLYFSYTTKNSAWAEIEGVNATNEPIIVSGIMLIVHIYIMSAMSGIIYA